MGEDRQFSIGIRQAMTDANYTDRLRAAIDASPYMQAAAKEAVRRRADGEVARRRAKTVRRAPALSPAR